MNGILYILLDAVQRYFFCANYRSSV